MFKISESQEKQIAEFILLQSNDGKYEGAIGGRFSYIFTPTSLGICFVLRDNMTMEELYLTEYGDW